jgi:Ca-activated chloride channel family protein
MMNSKPQCFSLETEAGYEMVFLGASVKATVRNTSTETVMCQRFRNPRQETVEVVYNFPLPVQAVLLSLQVRLNGTTYSGKVQEAKQAERRYEEAITDGDTPILLKQVSESFFNLNLGNLQAGDEVEIEMRYSQLHSWQGDQLRMVIPTTLAPRYGNPADLGMSPEQVTGSSLLVEYRADLAITIEGELAQSRMESPSHPVSFWKEDGKIGVSGREGGIPMDRDFVLTFHRAGRHPATAYYDRDLEGNWVAWLSFRPEVDMGVRTPRHLKIVLDCSGSMGGNSIAQARIALREIIGNLLPGDAFNIIRFGSSAESLFPASQLATAEKIQQALQWIPHIEADMGGTEMAAGLQMAYRSCCGAGEYASPEVLLITDGQVSAVNELVNSAKKSGHRHFTVGVGSSVSEDVVRRLAKSTGGACELVTPGEGMAPAIVRHFKRVELPPVSRADILWPCWIKPLESSPFDGVFSTDTVHHFARLPQKPIGSVTVYLSFSDKVWSETIPLQPWSDNPDEGELPVEQLTLARIAAASRIRECADANERIKLGFSYQLQSKETSYLVVAERDKKDYSECGPALISVPNMLPAGWGAVGAVSAHRNLSEHFCLKQMDDVQYMIAPERDLFISRMGLDADHFSDRYRHLLPPDAAASFILRMGLDADHFSDRYRHLLPPDAAALLQELLGEYPDENLLVLAILSYLLGSDRADEIKASMQLSRDDCRAIAREWKRMKKEGAISKEDAARLEERVRRRLQKPSGL